MVFFPVIQPHTVFFYVESINFKMCYFSYSVRVERVVFCCGKHYYALVKKREEKQMFNTALIRVEQLCPFPAEALQLELNKYHKAKGMCVPDRLICLSMKTLPFLVHHHSSAKS